MSVTAAEGFVAAGLHAGIKASRRDVALLATDDGKPVPAAAVFTTNKFRAPPVDASVERLEASAAWRPVSSSISGNANAGTGAKGRADAEAMCEAAAEAVGCDRGDMLVCSTGLIGFRLPMRKILGAIPKLGETLSAAPAIATRPRASSPPTRGPRRRWSHGDGLRSAAWPRAAACWRPTWRPCSPS